jgi:hypothetical protein
LGGFVRPQSSDPFQAAITSVLKPALSALGLKPIGGRLFGRVSDDVFQFVYLDKRLYGSVNFDVGVNAIPLFMGKEALILAPPGFGLGVFSSPTHPEALAQMLRAVSAIQEQGAPWLQRVSTVGGLLAQLEGPTAEPWETWMFMRATCLARLDRTTEAKLVLDELLARAVRDWVCLPGSKPLQLAERINQTTHQTLLAEWSVASRQALKLQHFV